MPRPSMKAQRTAEILTAFRHCIAKHGLEGSSLERLAEESGLQRSLIRHFVGNRDDLIHLLAAKTVLDFQQQTDFMYTYLPETGRIDALIDILFDPAHSSSTEQILVFEALIAAAERYPKIRAQLQQWLDQFNQQMSSEIKQAHPEASVELCDAISFGISSLYFNLDSLSPLAMSATYRHSAVLAAKQLIRSIAVTKES